MKTQLKLSSRMLFKPSQMQWLKVISLNLSYFLRLKVLVNPMTKKDIERKKELESKAIKKHASWLFRKENPINISEWLDDDEFEEYKTISDKEYKEESSKRKEEPGKTYVCPNPEGCDYNTFWTMTDIRDKGEPVCPTDDEDLVQGCGICFKPEDDDGRCGCTNQDAHGL